MLKNKKKNGNSVKLSKSDIDLYKMTGVFAIACIFVLLVLRMESTLILREASGDNLTYNVRMFCSNPLFLVPAACVLAAAVVWFAYAKVKKIDESGRIFTSTNALSLALYLTVFVLCFGAKRIGDMHGFFISLTVIGAVTYFVSKIYRTDFTLFTTVTAANVLAVQLSANRFDIVFILAKIAVIAVSFASIVMCSKKIKSMKLTKKRKSSFLIAPAYVSAAMGAVFMFVRFLSTLAAYVPLSAEETATGSSGAVVAIADFAAAIDMKVMFMAFLFEYIIFAIVYTLRIIKE